MRSLFGTERPIIGLLHLHALPGDPFFDEHAGVGGVAAAARNDLAALQDGGVDAILVTNEFSVPYQKRVSPVTAAAMAYVIGSLASQIRVPFGTEVIYDGDATMDVCAATGAQFTRCVFTDVWAGDLGLIDRDVASTIRHKHDLRLDDLRLFYFVTSEGETNLGRRSTAELIDSLAFNCKPDAYVVGGSAAGMAPDTELLRELGNVAGATPVVAGTGCRPDTVASVLAAAHGAFVGTSIKVDGKIWNPVDRARVRAFMELARIARGDE